MFINVPNQPLMYIIVSWYYTKAIGWKSKSRPEKVDITRKQSTDLRQSSGIWSNWASQSQRICPWCWSYWCLWNTRNVHSLQCEENHLLNTYLPPTPYGNMAIRYESQHTRVLFHEWRFHTKKTQKSNSTFASAMSIVNGKKFNQMIYKCVVFNHNHICLLSCIYVILGAPWTTLNITWSPGQ